MKTKMGSRTALFSISACIGLTFAACVPARASTLITFDDLGLAPLADVTAQYAFEGVTFQGFADSGAPVNLEAVDSTVYPDVNPASPPFALSNFYNHDKTQRAHIMRIVFSSPQSHVRLMFNGAGSMGANTAFKVYSPAGVLVDTFTVAAATDTTMHPVNVPDANVGYLDIVAPQTGWGFYIDNVQFGPPKVTFDDIGLPALEAVTFQYASLGVAFEGFTDSGCMVNLDVVDDTVYPDVDPSSPPFALSNFYNKDKTQRAHVMRLSFSSPASAISFQFNGAGSLGSSTAVNVYSPAGLLLDTFTVAAATDTTMHPVNVPDANVGYIDIVAPQAGWGFYIDDVDFQMTWPPPEMITFDDLGLSALAAVTQQYASRDVVFEGFDYSGNLVSLDVADTTVYPDVNPASAPFALSSFYNNDKTQRAHIMRLLFNSPVYHLSLMFNGAGNLGANAAFNVYSPSGVLLDTFTVPAATDDTMHPVNMPDANIGYLDIVAPQSGWGFYIDNVQFAAMPTQVTASIARAVAISWASVSGGLYQVMWMPSVNGSTWAPLGSPVAGTGGLMTVFDTAAQGSRFYHVESVGESFEAKALSVVRSAAPAGPTNGRSESEPNVHPASGVPTDDAHPSSATRPAVSSTPATASGRATTNGGSESEAKVQSAPASAESTNGSHPAAAARPPVSSTPPTASGKASTN